MNSKQRILNAISYVKTDRVPISTYELCGYSSASFENMQPSYKQLMDFIRKNTDAITMWNPNCDAKIGLSAYDFPIKKDIVKRAGEEEITSTLKIGKVELTQKLLTKDNIITVWQTQHWCQTLEDVDAIMSIPFTPLSYDFSDYNRICSEVGDNGIIMASIPDAMCVAAELMNFENFTVWAMMEQQHFKATLNKIHKQIMINLNNMLQKGKVDLIRIFGAEYCTPPYLPPYLFKEYVVPYFKEMTDLIHKFGVKVRMHSHGKIGMLLDDIISTGVDCIDPVEDVPDGDTYLKNVKQKFNNKISIFGNVQLKLLESSSKQNVVDYVKYCMDSAKEGGGYIIMPTASPINIPLSQKTQDNYYEFINAALQYGKY